MEPKRSYIYNIVYKYIYNIFLFIRENNRIIGPIAMKRIPNDLKLTAVISAVHKFMD
jgi:hypothetical protein